MKKVLIVGGTGFIGKMLRQFLLSQGYIVFVLTRQSHDLSKSGFNHYIQWDGQSLGQWTDCLNAMDVVINLAGESIAGWWWTKARKQRLHDSRVQPTKLIVDAINAVDHPPALLINASGSGYYGPHDERILTELDPPGSDFLATLCQSWEGATQPHRLRQTRVVQLRIGPVFSHQGGMLTLLRRVFKWGLGGRAGHGRQWMSWIDSRDLVRIIMHVIEQPEMIGAVNAVAPVPVTNAYFSYQFARHLKRPCWAHVPSIAMKLLLWEMATVVLDGQAVKPQKLIDSSFEFKYPTIELSFASTDQYS